MLKSKKIPIEFLSRNPKKFKKSHKIKLKKAMKFTKINNGTVLAAQKIEYVPVKRVVTLMKIMKLSIKKVSRKARLNLELRPTELFTRKPKDIRMGRGKGAPTERMAVAGNKNILSLHRIHNSSYKSEKLFSQCKPKYYKSKTISISK